MQFLPNNIYHIYNQGNNRQDIFLHDEDFLIFLRMIRNEIHINASIVAWCLMPNHFHLLIYTTENSCEKIKQGGLEIEKLTNGVRKLLSGYARIFNKKYNRTGSLFRQKTKAKNLSEINWVINSKLDFHDYCSRCFDYIHLNSVFAGLVTTPENWSYSSYCDYAGLRAGTLCNKELAVKYCGYNETSILKKDSRGFGKDFLESFGDD